MKLRILQPDENKNDPLFSSPECRQLIESYESFYPKVGFHLPWVAYLIIRDERVVGTCSFVGKPVNGVVEIAYYTFKEYEGQGLASFACKELIAIAKKENPDIIVSAKTAPEINASTRILEKSGFVHTGDVQDEEIGTAWFWTLHK